VALSNSKCSRLFSSLEFSSSLIPSTLSPFQTHDPTKHTNPHPDPTLPPLSEREPGKLKYNKDMELSISEIAEQIIRERNPEKRQEILNNLSLQEIFQVLSILGHKE